MWLTNARIFVDGARFIRGSLRIENGRFAEIREAAGSAEAAEVARSQGSTEEVRDLHGLTLLPGLIDIHTHGNTGEDFSDGEEEGLRKMARYLLQNGITSFAPASMTLPEEVLAKAYRCARAVHDAPKEGEASLIGINMEGPFFSEKKKGAQNAAFLKDPDIGMFTRLNEAAGGLIRLADLAPELPGAVEYTKAVSKVCTVSVAHTDAGYEDARAVYEAGATHLTHLFNAMPPLHHRAPGVIGAAAERENVYAELICDGMHVHESAVRLAFKLFPGRICLISDALRCTGMPDGKYLFGGQDIWLAGGIGRLADGTIAGSVSNLRQCLQKAVSFGIPEEEAVRAATFNPAHQAGCADEMGSVSAGKRADLILCDERYELREVWKDGRWAL